MDLVGTGGPALEFSQLNIENTFNKKVWAPRPFKKAPISRDLSKGTLTFHLFFIVLRSVLSN